MKSQQRMNAPQLYEIRVSGHLSANWVARFEGLSMKHEPEGATALTGKLDQAALHGVFMKIRSLGLNLISVNRIGTTEASYPGARNGRFQTKGDMKNE
jgi:hypothetical protein